MVPVLLTLTECYRIKEPAHEAYSVVLAPKDHPTTQQEVASLREELKEEFQKPFLDFKDRYLRF